MSEVIRLQRGSLRIGLFGLVAYPSMLLISIGAVWLRPDEFPGPLSIVCSTVPWALFILLSAWLVTAYYRESVCVSEDSVRITTVFGAQSLCRSDITRIRWSHGRVTIYANNAKTSLWLTNYQPSASQRLVRFFRNWVSPDIQEGWTDEIERHLSKAVEQSSPERVRQFNRSIARISLVGGLLGGLASGIVLHVVTGYFGTEAVTVTGSYLLDWGLLGAAIPVGLLGLGWLLSDSR